MSILSREAVIRHPVLSGLCWAVVTVPLTALIMTLTGLKSFGPDQFWRVAILVFVAGPAFGFLLRWAYLREDARAR